MSTRTRSSARAEPGINLKIVSERLGHSKVALTLYKKSHVLPHMQAYTTDKIGDLLYS
jgi:hypothetical protein